MAAASILCPFRQMAVLNTVNGVPQKVEVCRTTIHFNQQNIPVVIKGFIDRTSDYFSTTPHKRMVFEIERVDAPGVDIGLLTIARIWNKISPSGHCEPNYHHDGDDTDNLNSGDTLQNPRLYVEKINDHLRSDTKTGNWPVLRLLIQVAVEIFMREPESQLVIRSDCMNYSYNASVCIAGGFIVNPPYSYLTAIFKEALSRGRTAGRLFYPPGCPFGLGQSFEAVLNKNPSYQPTQFVTKEQDGIERPAFVDFNSPSHLISWEQQIQNNRLLPNTQGPVLPRFDDLSRFERPALLQ
jgi:hypothetical protein